MCKLKAHVQTYEMYKCNFSMKGHSYSDGFIVTNLQICWPSEAEARLNSI
jgi:hypothetical protein